jgi:hypothetical protein
MPFGIVHKDEVPLPFEQWASIQMADLAGSREYVLRHPYFPVELRAASTGTRKGYAREWCYPGDFQLRLTGRPWPRRWTQTSDFIGTMHELCFDARGPRLSEAMGTIGAKLQRALERLGIEDRLPSAEDASRLSLHDYGRMPLAQWR